MEEDPKLKSARVAQEKREAEGKARDTHQEKYDNGYDCGNVEEHVALFNATPRARST